MNAIPVEEYQIKGHNYYNGNISAKLKNISNNYNNK